MKKVLEYVKAFFIGVATAIFGGLLILYYRRRIPPDDERGDSGELHSGIRRVGHSVSSLSDALQRGSDVAAEAARDIDDATNSGTSHGDYTSRRAANRFRADKLRASREETST